MLAERRFTPRTAQAATALAADTEAIRVLLADADAAHRAWLRRLLHTDDGITVIAEAPTAHHALTLALRTQPDVIVLDVTLQGADAIALARRIRTISALSETRVLIRGNGDELEALRAGASGLLPQSLAPAQLIHAVRLVAGGGIALLSTDFVARMTAQPDAQPSLRRLARLTIREAEIVALVARGAGTRAIGDRLHISPETVKTHIRNAMRKLGVHGRTELAAVAYESGLVQPRRIDTNEGT